jgi:catechol 2,3-dioxygenase-like lactoylglutathione lyase family enzyme
MHLDHVTIRTRDWEATRRFFLAVFDLKEGALGGVIGGVVVDSSLGAGPVPFAAALIPLAALILILTQERGHGVRRPVQARVAANPAVL